MKFAMIYDNYIISHHFEVWALNKSNPDLHLDLLFSCIGFTQLWRFNAFLLAISHTTTLLEDPFRVLWAVAILAPPKGATKNPFGGFFGKNPFKNPNMGFFERTLKGSSKS